ncbi:hypothetical protein F0562_026237 [Nyssa sinensis]|uniref:MCAfunc domain-containing protein n=1 Tax=Nyssa sinensis TaxID=561372 RepID=A0A5J5B8H9_9ASTE|nr:hypothetical protein F0562_026237 [Nyssa sinensis]
MESVAQVLGVNAMGLINLIAAASRNATTHRKNCEKLAGHVRMVGNLLEKLKSTDLRNFPATGEPLDRLEEALRKAFDLVESCNEKSYLYVLSMGWSIVYQFRQVQNEIDRYLKLVPLISLVHEYRIQNLKESLQAIEEDHQEYTLDEEDTVAQSVILKRDRTKKDANILEKSLSRRYPEFEFQDCSTRGEREATKNVVNVPPEKNLSLNAGTYTGSRYGTATKSNYRPHELQSEDQAKSEWQADLFDCCGEPCLSLKTCIYPCGIFTRIAHVSSKGKITRERACNDLMAYSLFCGCCCYSGCVRSEVRKLFNIEGGSCDDFLTHLMCCCCAMVQEWRELELRGFEGFQGRKMIPPPCQYMKP